MVVVANALARVLLFVWGGNRASRVWLRAPVGAVAADPCASFTRTCARPHLFTGLTEAQCALIPSPLFPPPLLLLLLLQA